MPSKETEKCLFLFPEELHDQDRNCELLCIEQYVLKCG